VNSGVGSLYLSIASHPIGSSTQSNSTSNFNLNKIILTSSNGEPVLWKTWILYPEEFLLFLIGSIPY
jgi:hypothetical protein